MNTPPSSIGYYILFFAFLFLINVYPLKSAHSQFSCLPTCSEVDAKSFVFIGESPNGIQNTDMNFGITSPAASATVEIGLFDGDGTDSDWDLVFTPGAGVDLLFTLFADPDGEGNGTFMVAQWSSDGSTGSNAPVPMPNNDWFTAIVDNVDQAISPSGDYKYNLLVEIIDSAPLDRNSFKIRTDGFLVLFALQMFSFNAIVTQNSFENLMNRTGDFFIVFPDLDITNPACEDPLAPGNFCDARDPSCCLFINTYDGMWNFFFRVPPTLPRLGVWDGDFDYGSSVRDPDDPTECIIGGPALDTDDPNTGPIIPGFAADTDSVIQGVSVPTDPRDDFCSGFAPRSPSAQYSFIDPSGLVYENQNPSGNQEWELFSVTDVPPLDPLVDDLLVPSIPEGVWNVKTIGLDMYNVNLFFFDYAIIGVNEEGEPVDPPPDPRTVPTLSEWGLIATAGLLGIIGFIVIRRRQLSTNS